MNKKQFSNSNQSIQFKGVQKMLVQKLITNAVLEDGSTVEVITPEQAAKEFNKCFKTIYNWVDANKVVKVEGVNQVLIVKDSIAKYVAQLEMKKQSKMYSEI